MHHSHLLLRLLCILLCLILAVPAMADGFSVETRSLTDAEKLIKGCNTADRTYMYVNFGNYPYYSDGSVAPCLWRVLYVEDDVAFLLNEYIVDFYQFHHVKKDQPTWKDYDIYTQMNTEMLNNMFTPEEQEVICLKEDLGKLFILDNSEFMTPAYGFRKIKIPPQWERKCAPTPYAVSLPVSYVNENGMTWYWSRTCRCTAAGGYENIIGYDGHISMAGYLRWGGVRPACYIQLSKLDHVTGSGTIDDPYSFEVVQ